LYFFINLSILRRNSISSFFLASLRERISSSKYFGDKRGKVLDVFASHPE